MTFPVSRICCINCTKKKPKQRQRNHLNDLYVRPKQFISTDSSSLIKSGLSDVKNQLWISLLP